MHAIHDSRSRRVSDDMQRWITSLKLRGGFTSAPSCARYSTPLGGAAVAVLHLLHEARRRHGGHRVHRGVVRVHHRHRRRRLVEILHAGAYARRRVLRRKPNVLVPVRSSVAVRSHRDLNGSGSRGGLFFSRFRFTRLGSSLPRVRSRTPAAEPPLPKPDAADASRRCRLALRRGAVVVPRARRDRAPTAHPEPHALAGSHHHAHELNRRDRVPARDAHRSHGGGVQQRAKAELSALSSGSPPRISPRPLARSSAMPMSPTSVRSVAGHPHAAMRISTHCAGGKTSSLVRHLEPSRCDIAALFPKRRRAGAAAQKRQHPRSPRAIFPRCTCRRTSAAPHA